jgi:hypothetical protein
MSATGVPAVLTDPATEPEAAHLRNVLRQIGTIVADDRRCLVDRTLIKILAIAREALERSATNGTVIDALTKENGDLQSELLELRERLRQYRESTISGQVGQ